MADGEVNVKVKITADTKGSQEAEKSIEKVGKASQETAKQATGGFQNIIDRSKKVQGAVNALKSAFAFTVVVTAIKGVVDMLGKWGQGARDAKTEAENLKKAQREAAAAKEIEAATEAWKKLADEIQRARTERERMNELEDEQRDASRKMEDAQLRADEASEIEQAGGDADKENLIRNRYAARRAQIAASRTVEDFDTTRQREQAEAQAKYSAASAKEREAAALDARIKRLEAAATQAAYRATGDNEQDYGVMGHWGKNIGKFVTLDWGNWGDNRSERGDQIRQESAEEAKALRQKVEDLKKERERLSSEAAANRQEADHLTKVSATRQGARSAVVMEGSTTVGTANREVTAAQKTIDDKTEMHADAITAAENLQREKAAAEQRKAEAEQRRAAAQRAQFDAQSNFDLVKANKGDVGSAAKQLDEAKRTAAAVDRETTALIASLDQTLRNIEGRLKAANNEIRKDQSQTQYAWSEQPAG